MPENQPSATPTTYVLVGNDPVGAMDFSLDSYKAQKDVVIIKAQDYPSFADAVKQIKQPANILFDCHGDKDGTFVWSDGDHKQFSMYDFITYEEAFAEFKKLPQQGSGIQTVTIANCYGGTALDAGGELPAGTILQSMVGPKIEDLSGVMGKFAIETKGASDRLSFMLEAIDNVSPKHMLGVAGLNDVDPPALDPNNVMPGQIVIGGKSPIPIMLDPLATQLTQDPHKDRTAFDKAAAAVHAHFDSQDGLESMNRLEPMWKEAFGMGMAKFSLLPEAKQVEMINQKLPEMKATVENMNLVMEAILNAAESMPHDEDDKAMQAKIDHVVDDVRHGKPMKLDKDGNPDFDELRIRRALGIAYLETSGKLEQLVQQAKQAEQSQPTAVFPPEPEAKPEPINPLSAALGANGPDATMNAIAALNQQETAAASNKNLGTLPTQFAQQSTTRSNEAVVGVGG